MADANLFSQKSENFLAWFRSLPGATFHEDVSVRDLRHQNAGRGIGGRTRCTLLMVPLNGD